MRECFATQRITTTAHRAKTSPTLTENELCAMYYVTPAGSCVVPAKRPGDQAIQVRRLQREVGAHAYFFNSLNAFRIWRCRAARSFGAFRAACRCPL